MFKRILAVAAGAALPLAFGAAALASPVHVKPAITPSCGFACFNLYNKQAGANLIQNAYAQSNPVSYKAGGLVNLSGAVNDGWREDFTDTTQGDELWQFDGGTQADAAFTGDAGPGGIISQFSYAALHLPGDSPVIEADADPFGNDSGLCVTAVTFGTPVQLRACGQNGAKDLWIADSANGYLFSGEAFINGASANISHPYVLALKGNSKKPADELITTTETKTGNQVIDSEQFAIEF